MAKIRNNSRRSGIIYKTLALFFLLVPFFAVVLPGSAHEVPPKFDQRKNNSVQSFLLVYTNTDHLDHEVIKENIFAASKYGTVTVLCSSLSFVHDINAFQLQNVAAKLISIKELINIDSPLAPWLRNQTIIKIITGKHFPMYFQYAISLAALYEHGGVLLENGIRVHTHKLSSFIEHAEPWCIKISHGLKAMYAHHRHPAVKETITKFVQEFPSYKYGDSWPVQWDDKWEHECPLPTVDMGLSVSDTFTAVDPILLQKTTKEVHHYGVLWLNTRTQYLHSIGNPGINVGDEVQNLASAQWLPFVDVHVERDNLSQITPSNLKSSPSVTLFMNAWYGTPTMIWPPPPSLDTIMIAIHIEPNLVELFSTAESVAYLKQHQPIGARDQATAEVLSSLGVESFLSHCMTLTMQSVVAPLTHGEYENCHALIIDVSPAGLEYIPASVQMNACNASAKWLDGGSGQKFDGVVRYLHAFELLTKIGKAKLVITSRLHSALPAASMGIPVVLMMTEDMPGGGGSNSGDDFQRFSGLSNLVHSFYTKNPQHIDQLRNFRWQDPPPNPGNAEMLEIRCRILNFLAKTHHQLLDAIYMFSVSVFNTCDGIFDVHEQHTWKLL